MTSFLSADDDITTNSPNSVLSGIYDIKTANSTASDSKTIEPSNYKTNQSDNPPNSQNSYKLTIAGIALEGEKLPRKIKPMLATPVDKAFNNKDWVFEIKWDGVRAIVFKENDNEITLQSKNGNDITTRYPEITKALQASLADKSFTILDGEIVYWTKMGFLIFRVIRAMLGTEPVTGQNRCIALMTLKIRKPFFVHNTISPSKIVKSCY